MERSQEVDPSRGQRVGNRELARRFLAAVEAGEPTRELRDELVRRVLFRTEVRLALEVDAGGSHVTRKAIRLAEMLSTESAARSKDEEAVS